MPPTVPVFRSVKLTKPSPSGPFREQLVDAVDFSAGSPDAGKLVVLNAAGQIDTSMGGGGGGSININGSSVSSPNFNDTLPAAPGGGLNILWQASSSNVSAYIPANTYDPFGAAASKLPLAGGTLTGDLLFSLDDTHDVGASGATRPRTIYVGTSVLAPLFNAATGFQIAGGAASGNVLRGNGTNFVSAQLDYGDLSGTPSLNFLPLAGGTLTGDLLFSLDNAHDIGALGATRPRSLYIGTSAFSPIFDAATGFRVAGAGTTGHVLRGNGTNFVDAQLDYGDLSGTPSLAFLPLAGGTLTGNLLFSTDNAHDIGASGATRPRHVYVGTDVVVPTLNITTNAGTVSVVGQTGSAAWSFQLPTSAGSSGNLLSTDGTGVLAWVSPGAGTLPNRTVVTISGGSLNSVPVGTTISGTVTIAKSFLLQKVVCTFPSRVRLYETAAQRDTTPGATSEPARPNTIPPTPGTNHGVICDLYLDGINAALTWTTSPTIPGNNNDVSPNTTIYYNVTNIGTATQNLSVTFTYLQMES